MADILKGRFGEPKKENPGEENSEVKKPLSTADAYRRAAAAEIAGDERAKGFTTLANPLVVEKARKLHDQLTTVVNFRASKEVLATAGQTWATLSNQELGEMIINATESDWKGKESSYLALIREHLNRLLKIKDIFSE